MATCRKCNAPIRWVKRYQSEKQIACSEKVTTVVTPSGEIIKGFQPHWQFCPYETARTEPKTMRTAKVADVKFRKKS